MIPDDVVRLPAGWYPDPTGLPQLRWWDNHAWTQHTTAARQPLIVQDSPLAWADDLPTRRERREREREDRGPDDLTPPTAQSLRELAPPSVDDEPADNPAPADSGNETASGAAPDTTSATTKTYDEDSDMDDSANDSSYVPVSASGHAGRIPSIPSLDVPEAEQAASPAQNYDPLASVPQTAPATGAAPASSATTSFSPTAGTPLFDQVVASGAGATTARHGDAKQPRTPRQDSTRSTRAQTPGPGLSAAPISTTPVWIIALLPLLQLVIVLVVVTGLGSTPSTELAMPAIVVVVYLVTAALAFADFHTLRDNGVARPAHWTWSLLTAPIYLFVRAMVLTRATGRGFGPVLTWFALALLSVASLLAVPGMLITSVPGAFRAQAEQSVAADAAANGASLEVSCPESPPILIGQSFTCTGKTDNGKSYEIEVSLQRINGWINWRVEDWGINTLSR